MNKLFGYTIIPIDDALRTATQAILDDSWSGPFIAVNGKLWDTRTMPGFAALDVRGILAGYLLYRLHSSECEIMVLESLRENAGVGTLLIDQVKAVAKDAGMKIVTVTTTNDNLHALRFYQQRGFALRALRVNILETSRTLKPSIPSTGIDNIPLRDEIELELAL